MVTVAAGLAWPAVALSQAADTGCHATGDPSAPYVLVDLTGEGADAHLDHAEDIVPAPAEGCPAATAPAEDPVPSPGGVGQSPDDSVSPQDEPGEVAPVDERAPAPERAAVVPGDSSRTPLAAERSAPAPRPLVATGHEARRAALSSLPVTGSHPWLLGLMGTGMLLAGAGGRLLAR